MADSKELLHEDGETMVIRHEDGSTIKIAKRGLHKYAQDQLRGMCKGGEVKGYWQGDEVAPVITGDPAVDAAIVQTSPGVWAERAPETWAELFASAPGGPARATGRASAVTAPPSAGPPGVATAIPTGRAFIMGPPAGSTALAPGQPPPVPAQTPGSATPQAAQTQAAPAPVVVPAVAQPAGPALPDFNSYMKDVKGFQKGFAGMGGTGEAHAAAAQAAQVAADAQTEYARQSAEMAADEKQRQTEVKAWQGEYQKAFEDFKSSKIDPQRFWNTRSDGQKVSAMVGMVLGGIGSGLTGGPNQAMQALERAIDRDFEAQKMEMGKKQNMVSMLFQKFGTIEAAHNAFRLYKAAEISAYANKTAAQLGGAQARLHAASIEQAAAQFATQNAMQLAQIKMNYGFMQSMLGGQGGGTQYAGGAQPAMPKTFDMAGIQGAAAENRERAIPGPKPGTQILAQDAGAAKIARDRLAGLHSLEELVVKLEALRKNAGVTIPMSDAQAEYKRLIKGAGQDYARMQGQLTEGSVKEGDAMFPGSFEQAFRGRTGLQPVRDVMESNRRAIYKTYAGIDMPNINAPEHRAR